jgi:hypothetical protein
MITIEVIKNTFIKKVLLKKNKKLNIKNKKLLKIKKIN